MGKSSLLNALTGKKVVSVSKTPGHTKHFQTIFLTKTVRLCDCPGLVFPSLVPKPLQVLAGLYPIAQLQEPYSAVRYISERERVIELLKIEHPQKAEVDGDVVWTPLDICEAWAIKRGYNTAKASRPDVYRAANEILRMALDGRLCLSLKPKGYYKELDFWVNHEDTQKLNEIVSNLTVLVKEQIAANKQLPVLADESSEESSDDSDIEPELVNRFHMDEASSESDGEE